MNFLGLDFEVKNIPELDPQFVPIQKFNECFLRHADSPVGIAVERESGEIAVCNTFVYSDEAKKEVNEFYINRLLKTMLWMKGGFRIFIKGNVGIYEYVKSIFSPGGIQSFDAAFMSRVYEHDFEVLLVDVLPEETYTPKLIGSTPNGCRIGFDAGGSDRKVSAVIDGVTVYSEEVVWYPKERSHPDYHYDGIVSAFKSAASHLPRVDAVGISSAGIYINNRTMVASLFLKVPEDEYQAKVKDIYIRAVRDTFGDIPFAVANDGDVTALAGVKSLGENSVLGIAMGTSEAAGFADKNGNVSGWLNELAFVPVDCNLNSEVDEWSGDYGCGVKYFSQDAVIKLAPKAGIEFSDGLSPAEKLKTVQALMKDGDGRAVRIFRSIGVYLAHSLAYYFDSYHFCNVLLLGRVMSGEGGETILSVCTDVLKDEYPELSKLFKISLPDEAFRRTGQSAVAAALPIIP